VQVDSVNTLARAHDLILWSRRPTYRPASLRWINDRARATFEHWTHDASIIPMAFYPHWRLRFARDRDRLHGRWKDWHGDRFHGELDRVLAHVSDNGPVSSGDFAGERAEKSTGWWDWHPSKTALEYLWRSGDLAVTRREGFRKLYDLSERVVPPEVLNARPRTGRDRGLGLFGGARPAGLRHERRTGGVLGPRDAFGGEGLGCDARASGRVIDVDVACADGSPALGGMAGRGGGGGGAAGCRAADARPQPLRPGAEGPQAGRAAFRLPLPHRDLRAGGAAALRLLRLPGAGGTRLAGRIDMAARAGRTCLTVRAFWPEAGVRMGSGRSRRLSDEIERVARLAGCGDVAFEPGWLKGFSLGFPGFSTGGQARDSVAFRGVAGDQM
jgi:hypothetical protein